MATLEAEGPDGNGSPPIVATAGPQDGATERPGRRRRVSLRLALAALAVAALMTAGLGVLYWPGAGPSIASVTVGSDGIPNQIDGQRVYRTQDLVDWLNVRGSFLLGARVSSGFWGGCWAVVSDTPVGPAQQASLDLYASCGGDDSLGGTDGPEVEVAPKGSGALNPWNDELTVVRVHTHDPEAAQCDVSIRDACETALVVEKVVWPTVPDQVDGQHVYRAADSAQFDKLESSFLLGGFVAAAASQTDGLMGAASEPTSQPCALPPKPTADQLLLPYCPMASIDGRQIAPASKVQPATNQIAVVRVHVNDARAAQCPAGVKPDCAKAIVVEQPVWSYNPYAAPYSIAEATTSPVGPPGIDGIPTTIGGQPVHRSDSLPADTSFLLGGRLTKDGPCPGSQHAATTGGSPVSACSPWKVGGVAVRTVVEIPSDVVGKLVVVEVVRSHVSDCAGTYSCGPQPALVVTEISWNGP